MGSRSCVVNSFPSKKTNAQWEIENKSGQLILTLSFLIRNLCTLRILFFCSLSAVFLLQQIVDQSPLLLQTSSQTLEARYVTIKMNKRRNGNLHFEIQTPAFAFLKSPSFDKLLANLVAWSRVAILTFKFAIMPLMLLIIGSSWWIAIVQITSKCGRITVQQTSDALLINLS